MSLDRPHVTAADQSQRRRLHFLLRMALPVFPIFFGALGLSFIRTPRSRLAQTPTFALMDQWEPMPVWGAVLIAVAGILVVSLAIGRLSAHVMGLALVVVVLAAWAFASAASSVYGLASPTAALWPLVVGYFALILAIAVVLGEQK